MPEVAETQTKLGLSLCAREGDPPEVFYYLSNLTVGHWWRSLCRLAAVRGAAVRPQWDLGLVWLPPRQIAQIFGIFGILIGQLLLQESLIREQQQKYQYCRKIYFLVHLKETEVSKKSSGVKKCFPSFPVSWVFL